MSITTYAELQTAVANWLDRDDLETRVTEFITLAEADIFDDLRIREMQTRADVTIDDEFVTIPTGFVEAVRFHIDASPIHLLEYRDPQQLNMWTSGTSGRPDFYTIIGTEFQFDRTGSSSYTGKLVYYKKPTSLSDSNTSNDVLSNYPNIYLYGALVHSEPFIGNDARMQTWKLMYTSAVKKANRMAEKALYGGSQLQMTSSR